jgi:hypothetical protein
MKGDKLVILPWRGEYGTMLMHHVRWVHSRDADQKVVFCRPGQEVLFPSATAFRYDWDSPPDYQKRSRLWRTSAHVEYMEGLAGRMKLEYPGFQILIPYHKHPNRPEPKFKLETGLLSRRVDVVLAPRHRQHAQNRNFQHWQFLADGLHERGYIVGLAGIRETSQDLTGVDEGLKGWNLGGDREQLQLLNTARVTVTTDSGIAHLAVLNQNPLMVLYDQEGLDGPDTKNAWTLPHMQAHAGALCAPLIRCWHNPVAALNSISNYLLTDSQHALHAPSPSDRVPSGPPGQGE